MKNSYLLILITVIFVSCIHKKHESNDTIPYLKTVEVEPEYIEPRDTVEIDESDYAKIKFDYYEFDAGDVPSGPKIEFEFPFTNIGEIPLVIRTCKSSSGLVVPICEDRFILPGGSGVFKAKHLTKGITGGTVKTLTMSANTIPERTVLYLKANIIKVEK